MDNRNNFWLTCLLQNPSVIFNLSYLCETVGLEFTRPGIRSLKSYSLYDVIYKAQSQEAGFLADEQNDLAYT